jgi:uncharacterized protein YjiS (DUF1127 family)
MKGSIMKAIDTIITESDELHLLPPRAGFVRRITVVIRSLAAMVDRMMMRRRTRLALLEMTDEQLKDIGVSRADAYREGSRPFWDGDLQRF